MLGAECNEHCVAASDATRDSAGREFAGAPDLARGIAEDRDRGAKEEERDADADDDIGPE